MSQLLTFCKLILAVTLSFESIHGYDYLDDVRVVVNKLKLWRENIDCIEHVNEAFTNIPEGASNNSTLLDAHFNSYMNDPVCQVRFIVNFQQFKRQSIHQACYGNYLL